MLKRRKGIEINRQIADTYRMNRQFSLSLPLIAILLFGMTSAVIAEKQSIREVLLFPLPKFNAQAERVPTAPPPPVIPDGEAQPSQPTATAIPAASPPPVFPAAESPAAAVDNDSPTVAAAAAVVQNEQWDEIGEASWYGGRFQGRQTANGEVFDTNLLTAAHQTLPFDTIVRVYNPQNSKSVLVRINDRGPFVDDRIIDLSRAAATQIGTAQAGVVEVYLQIMRLGEESKVVIIQLGAFSQYENAIDLISDLKRDGFLPQIENVNDALFRVVLANVNRERVGVLRQQLAEKGYRNILVRRR